MKDGKHYKRRIEMKNIFLLFCVATMLTGCTHAPQKEKPKEEVKKEEISYEEFTNNYYQFRGESQHWKATYDYTGTKVWRDDNGTNGYYADKNDHTFVLTYKGPLSELSSIKKMEYTFSTMNSEGYWSEEFEKPPTSVSFSSRGSSEGAADISKDGIVNVQVKWGEKEETFDLHNPDK